jgi:hypothetical protein
VKKRVCATCGEKRTVSVAGLMSDHVDGVGEYCRGSRQSPRLQGGTAKRIVHRDIKP